MKLLLCRNKTLIWGRALFLEFLFRHDHAGVLGIAFEEYEAAFFAGKKWPFLDLTGVDWPSAEEEAFAWLADFYRTNQARIEDAFSTEGYRLFPLLAEASFPHLTQAFRALHRAERVMRELSPERIERFSTSAAGTGRMFIAALCLLLSRQGGEINVSPKTRLWSRVRAAGRGFLSWMDIREKMARARLLRLLAVVLHPREALGRAGLVPDVLFVSSPIRSLSFRHFPVFRKRQETGLLQELARELHRSGARCGAIQVPCYRTPLRKRWPTLARVMDLDLPFLLRDFIRKTRTFDFPWENLFYFRHRASRRTARSLRKTFWGKWPCFARDLAAGRLTIPRSRALGHLIQDSWESFFSRNLVELTEMLTCADACLEQTSPRALFFNGINAVADYALLLRAQARHRPLVLFLDALIPSFAWENFPAVPLFLSFGNCQPSSAAQVAVTTGEMKNYLVARGLCSEDLITVAGHPIWERLLSESHATPVPLPHRELRLILITANPPQERRELRKILRAALFTRDEIDPAFLEIIPHCLENRQIHKRLAASLGHNRARVVRGHPIKHLRESHLVISQEPDWAYLGRLASCPVIFVESSLQHEPGPCVRELFTTVRGEKALPDAIVEAAKTLRKNRLPPPATKLFLAPNATRTLARLLTELLGDLKNRPSDSLIISRIS